jgi:hydroxyethylthiazole kinase-like uncharacterized protein yjeF
MSAWSPPPPPEFPIDAHKGIAGRVLCVCGSADMPGAAVLVARAAQRAGAGLVVVACTAEILRTIVPIAAPEAILLSLQDLDALRAQLAVPDWDAVVVGPGLGTSPRARELLDIALVAAAPIVLDADALNLLGTDLARLRSRRAATVLTPHPGEAGRLLGRAIPREEDGRVAAAREIAAQSGAICCLKGHHTVVSDGRRTYVNGTGNPGMATAGAGDVLAGITCAYLALTRTLPSPDWTAFDAAARAVAVHGFAGDLAARARGQRGLIASDLIEALPRAQA